MRYLNPIRRQLALVLLVIFLTNLVYIPTASALTGGPTQPELQGFQPVGSTDMVNLFTGDFSYNIPLFELPGPNGGYPFNLSYQSGISMDQEASWVGLGWSLNPGTINRQMRGLPDEFKGDEIQTKMDMDPSVTVGAGAGIGVEIFGNSNLSIGVGLGISQNNYKGFGYSIDASLGYEGAVKGSNSTAGIGVGLSLDSKEGIAINPSIGVGSIYATANYHSREGLYNVGAELRLQIEKAKKEDGKDNKHLGRKSYRAASISLASPGYTPAVSMPMSNRSLSLRFNLGVGAQGIYGHTNLSGFYNKQELKHKGEWVSSSAFGYLNYQEATGGTDLLDFNREQDGVVTKESPNLAIPSLTYDVYSVTGQGILGMYRPIRNDIGLVHDPDQKSTTAGAAAGLDVGIPLHVGVNLTINHAESRSGKWLSDNRLLGKWGFMSEKVDDSFEPWYFKVHGEPSPEKRNFIEELGDDQPVRVKLSGTNMNAYADDEIEKDRNWKRKLTKVEGDFKNRKQRSNVIQTVSNEQILQQGAELISLFNVEYIDKTGQLKKYDRSKFPAHHNAGFTVLSTDGLRYNYAIPAYNLEQEEVLFSALPPQGNSPFSAVGNSGEDPNYKHAHTNKFLKRVKTPEYAHSYLLTSIVGPDYVDITGDGVTEDDLGYWVKFTYQQTADDYQWRDPFYGAHFQVGWETDPRDDKASFVHGTKELWYLRKAETKSHIAEFALNQRQDARGVASKLQDNQNAFGGQSMALSRIDLYARTSSVQKPMKSVKFEYDYSLCKGVFNNSDANSGKLTLKKLWFEYGGVQKDNMYLTPYLFNYHTHNPNYDRNAYDRWGTYKPYPEGKPLHNNEFPYAEQDPAKKEEIDANAAAWSLTEIVLPSGGKLKVDYESDDYAYVQHLQAMQMSEIADPYASPGDASGATFSLRDDDVKVRFKLKSPIYGGQNLSSAEQRQEVLKYLDRKRKQLYFKYKINLRSQGEAFYEYIKGYVDIDMNATMGLEKDASGNYVFGYFSVQKEDGRNPFSMRAWQHLRANQPELANSGRPMQPTENLNEQVNQIKSLGSVFTQVRQMFEGFYNYCANKNWGRQVSVEESWIRLNSPDKVKYGGGLRVRQITLMDEWNEDQEGIYGQVYEYTKVEDGKTISSGVAAYEPLIGGDENPLRFAKKWVESVPLRADNVLFFEYPINESYYPGPQVGYSMVTVSSLPTAWRAGKDVKNITLLDGNPLFPSPEIGSFGTTGQTVHEFYTAREFPIISDETAKDDKPFKQFVPVPLLGSINMSYLTSTQGYSVITNDMHGREKGVSNFRQNADGTIDLEKPDSYIKYNYFEKERSLDGEMVFEPDVQFLASPEGSLRVATREEISNPAIEKWNFNQENEFFVDVREHTDKSWVAGGNFNTDGIFIFVVIPIPTFWPSVTKSEVRLRTVVTNKVIFKSSVLKSIEAFDGGSKVVTENLKWDKLTGNVLLSRLNNNFDEPVYQFNIPAYSQYQGMGAAYQNIGMRFAVRNLQVFDQGKNLYRFSNNSAVSNLLYPGDEVLLYNDIEATDLALRAIYHGERDGEKIFYCPQNPAASNYTGMVTRSGRRNQLNVSAASITALKDPSEGGTHVTHTKQIQMAK